MVISPVPQPVPFYIRQSTPLTVSTDKKRLVVGLPKAVAGAGKVHVKDRTSGASVVVLAAAAGSFSTVLAVGETADLEVRYETQDGLSEPVSLSAQVRGPNPELTPSNILGPDPVSSPDAQGQVTVTNENPGQPPHFLATPNSEALVSNDNNGATVSTKTNANGILRVQLAGATGDVIHVLLASTENSALTSDFLTYTVP
jgi:hypothetical protein